jgi:hypothetical protein
MSIDRSPTELHQRPSTPPYPPSCIDAFVAWVDRLPGPAWVAYLVALVGFAVLNNVAFWLDGSLVIGAFVFTRSVDAFFIVYFLALYRHLGSVAGRCL